MRNGLMPAQRFGRSVREEKVSVQKESANAHELPSVVETVSGESRVMRSRKAGRHARGASLCRRLPSRPPEPGSSAASHSQPPTPLRPQNRDSATASPLSAPASRAPAAPSRESAQPDEAVVEAGVEAPGVGDVVHEHLERPPDGGAGVRLRALRTGASARIRPPVRGGAAYGRAALGGGSGRRGRAGRRGGDGQRGRGRDAREPWARLGAAKEAVEVLLELGPVDRDVAAPREELQEDELRRRGRGAEGKWWGLRSSGDETTPSASVPTTTLHAECTTGAI